MKYQDLCIRLSEILRARGINTIYFEDVNLLNSEDVVYPAAVVQLARVEQETQSDIYTIMLTIAEKIGMPTRVEGDEEWQKIDVRILATYGYMVHSGSTIYFNKTLNTCGISDILPKCRLKLQKRVMPNDISILTFGYKELRPNYFNDVFNVSFSRSEVTYLNESPYYRRIQSYDSTGDVHNVDVFVPKQVSRGRTSIVNNVRGITDILAEDEHIQINSCVTTPFRWKFRDECEGITAEINLSLFFDSRCN